MSSERIAVLEEQQIQNQKDLSALYKFMRDHMDREEERWDSITKDLTDLKEQKAKEKGFLGGAIFILSALWAIIFAALTFWFKTH